MNLPAGHAENDRRLAAAARRLCEAMDALRDGADARFDLAAEVPPALEKLTLRFGLSNFERDLLLLAALAERDPALAQRVGAWHGDEARTHVSFELAQALLQAPDRLALSPSAALRRWRLIEVATAGPLAQARLAVDERVQFYLEGHGFLDARLEGLIRPLRATPRADAGLLARVCGLFHGARSPAQCPVVELSGTHADDHGALVAAACRELRLCAYVLSAGHIPAPPAEREAFARLWEREAMLLDAALLIDAGEPHGDDGTRLQALLHTLEAIVFVSTRGGLPAVDRPLRRVALPPRQPRREIERWRAALGPLAAGLDDSIERAAQQFDLDDDALATVAAAARSEAAPQDAGDALWQAARAQSRRGLDSLAERVDTRAGWDALVLPDAQLDVLRQIAVHVRERHRVYRDWGFADQCTRGLGIAALFSGGSGTGKTLAAEVLAQALALDLYRVDLARLVSKYIGETEKNLARVFDAAEACGAIVLFDEADALFGKRSEVRDSHDRYANIEVGYLLQRIETYRGLSVLTTNIREAVDPAFLRRIRFIVQFPFPDAAARRGIWAQAFPPAMPREGLDLERLARLNVAGGQIRNIALGAAFLAAGRGEPVRMGHLRRAAEAEYAKLEKPLPRAELEGWA